MAGWYVRRGEKVVGPVDNAKLKELAGSGGLLPTDLLAADVAGPWQAAGGTSLFSPDEPDWYPVPAVSTAKSSKTELAKVERTPDLPDVKKPNVGLTILRGGAGVVSAIGKGALAATGAAGRALEKRSQRKHELKLAKIQAQALKDSQRPPAPPAAPPPVTTVIREPPPSQSVYAPQVVRTTVVNIENRRNYAYGCYSLIVLMLLILVGAIIAGVYYSAESKQLLENWDLRF